MTDPANTQPQPQPQPDPKKKKGLGKWFALAGAFIVVAAIASNIGGGDDDTSDAAPPPAVSSSVAAEKPAEDKPKGKPKADKPKDKPKGPSSEAIIKHVTAGYAGMDEACIAGVTWLCDVEDVEVHGTSTLTIKYRTLSTAGDDGKTVARKWFTMIALSDGGPMPDLNLVQVVNYNGKGGSYNHALR